MKMKFRPVVGGYGEGKEWRRGKGGGYGGWSVQTVKATGLKRWRKKEKKTDGEIASWWHSSCWCPVCLQNGVNTNTQNTGNTERMTQVLLTSSLLAKWCEHKHTEYRIHWENDTGLADVQSACKMVWTHTHTQKWQAGHKKRKQCSRLVLAGQWSDVGSLCRLEEANQGLKPTFMSPAAQS